MFSVAILGSKESVLLDSHLKNMLLLSLKSNEILFTPSVQVVRNSCFFSSIKSHAIVCIQILLHAIVEYSSRSGFRNW